MSELNISLEYLPVTKELRDVSTLDSKNKNIQMPQIGYDAFGNPRFQVNNNITCTVQKSRDEKWYIAFVRVSELIDNSYNNVYFKAFAKIDQLNEFDNKPYYFDRFIEWVKEDGKWVQKNY